MAENSEEAPRENNTATFAWLRTPRPDRLALRVSYRDVSLRLEWADDEALDRLIAHLAPVIVAARKELTVMDFVKGMDEEIEHLLGGGE